MTLKTNQNKWQVKYAVGNFCGMFFFLKEHVFMFHHSDNGKEVRDKSGLFELSHRQKKK